VVENSVTIKQSVTRPTSGYAAGTGLEILRSRNVTEVAVPVLGSGSARARLSFEGLLSTLLPG
jgi:hypothetical protein